jgi:UDP-N-acetylglucosamine 2-epimerase (non-hydrolysing)
LDLVTVNTGQHTDLLQPLFELFGIPPAYNLEAMVAGQSLNALGSRLLERLDPSGVEKPDLVLVQGDTSSAVMGSMAAFNRRIPVGHLEAGLRSGNPLSPFPEEMNRRWSARSPRITSPPQSATVARCWTRVWPRIRFISLATPWSMHCVTR